MPKILKSPAEYAQEIYNSWLNPAGDFVSIIIELARLSPRLPEDYIRDTAGQLKRIIKES